VFNIRESAFFSLRDPASAIQMLSYSLGCFSYVFFFFVVYFFCSFLCRYCELIDMQEESSHERSDTPKIIFIHDENDDDDDDGDDDDDDDGPLADRTGGNVRDRGPYIC
jgi:hypothetical protein